MSVQCPTPDPQCRERPLALRARCREYGDDLLVVAYMNTSGRPLELNRMLPGDAVSETTGVRERLSAEERAVLAHAARCALGRMIAITERPTATPCAAAAAP
jgi:hypothetical protein